MTAFGVFVTTKVSDRWHGQGVKGEGQIYVISLLWFILVAWTPPVFFGGWYLNLAWLLKVGWQQRFLIANVPLESKVKAKYI